MDDSEVRQKFKAWWESATEGVDFFAGLSVNPIDAFKAGYEAGEIAMKEKAVGLAKSWATIYLTHIAAFCIIALAVTGLTLGLVCANAGGTFEHGRLWAKAYSWQWPHEIPESRGHVETKSRVMNWGTARYAKLIDISDAPNNGQMLIFTETVGHTSDGGASEYRHSETPKIGFISECWIQFRSVAIFIGYRLGVVRDLFIGERHHEIANIEGWRCADNLNSETSFNSHTLIGTSQRHVWLSFWTEPRKLISNQRLFRGLGSTLSSIGGFVISTVHLDRVCGINRQKNCSNYFHEKLGRTLPILFLLASNLTMAMGWLILRRRCRCRRDWWIGVCAVVGGFTASVWGYVTILP